MSDMLLKLKEELFYHVISAISSHVVLFSMYSGPANSRRNFLNTLTASPREIQTFHNFCNRKKI